MAVCEGNTRLLNRMFEDGDIGNQRIAEEMKDMHVEEERVRYLKKMFNESIARFESIPLWEGTAPETNPAYEEQNQPQFVFFPAKGGEKKGVVLVAPGGGYNVKSVTFEGFPIVKKLTDSGINAAILDYRLKPYPMRVSLMDMQRAIRVLRSRSEELGINPERIAVHGSSAGGHLSSVAAVHYDTGRPESEDPIEHYSCRPDAVILSYGAFCMGVQYEAVSGISVRSGIQREGLYGLAADPDVRETHYWSPDKYVTPDTPPFFLWLTSDQDDPRSACVLIRALNEAGVRCEAHIFPFGPHGTGMADGQNPMNYKDEHVAHWAELAVEWLNMYGF